MGARRWPGHGVRTPLVCSGSWRDPSLGQVLLSIAALGCAGANPAAGLQDGVVDQQVSFIWPTAVWSGPLAPEEDPGEGERGSKQTSARLARALKACAKLGKNGFHRYITEILPKELDTDRAFAEEFHSSDGSRMNLGFMRWQKRVVSERFRMPVESLLWDGKPVPRLPGISYEWNELHGAKELSLIVSHVHEMATHYMNQLEEGSQNSHENKKWETFVWVEVYRPGDFQRPHVHTGAAITGTVFVRHKGRSPEGFAPQQLVFEDVRGHTPPFGKAHIVDPLQGDLVLWPSWAPHYLTPNPGNTTNVHFCFALWPPGGAAEFDWEDDPLGDYVHRKVVQVRQRTPPPSADAPAKAEPLGPGSNTEL